MRLLDNIEIGKVSGGAIRQSDKARARQCAADIERAGELGAKFGGRIAGKAGEWAGDLLGQMGGIKSSKACQDQIRLSRQRNDIDRMRNGDTSERQLERTGGWDSDR